MRLAVARLAAIAALGCGGGGGSVPVVISTPLPSAIPAPGDPVIGAAGDIACGPGTPRGAICKDMETSELLIEMGPAAVLPLGDLQYETGRYEDFLRFYDLSWGRLKPITRPAVGNHEYETAAASGYFDYFNGVGTASGASGPRGQGFYSFDVGTWHLIAINSNCSRVGGCGAGSAQERWLRADLAANPRPCTLAYWHHPLFSSGNNGNHPELRPIWQVLYDANADVILTGHDHNYERFSPQTPAGVPDRARGIRQFVVGTGGRAHEVFRATQPNSEVRNNDSFGVLRLTLQPRGYEWEFVAIEGGTFKDAGSDTCH